jgi:hypothetical protein
MAGKQPNYLSYLLRLWRASSQEQTTWRASLERSDTRERTAFTNLDSLFEFLREQAGVVPKTREGERMTKSKNHK